MPSSNEKNRAGKPVPSGRSRASDATLIAIGRGLVRPECVVAHESGLLFTSDWSGRGGVAIIDRDGSVERLQSRNSDFDLKPNGIAFEPGGSFLVAHLGADRGGLFRLYADGSVEPVLTAIDGHALPPSNFPLIDHGGRIWLTVSSRVQPRADDYRASSSTGFIVLIDRRGARIVADGLGYTNECAISADGQYLYVSETFARRLSRFDIGADGALDRQTVITSFGSGTFPDGIAMDRNGGLWITSIVSNRVIRVTPDGRQTIVVEDADPDHVSWVEAAFLANDMGRPHLDTVKGHRLRNISSLAFAGPELETAVIGSLLGDTLFTFQPGIAGLELAHYRADLGPWKRLLQGTGL